VFFLAILHFRGVFFSFSFFSIDNDIGDEGAGAIRNGMENNKTLIHLDLYGVSSFLFCFLLFFLVCVPSYFISLFS